MIICFALLFPASLAAKTPVILALAAIVTGIVSFVWGTRQLARNRLLAGTPTSRLSGASPGLVEVSGFAAGSHTMPAPITGHPCYLYRTTAWEQRNSGGHQEWEKVAEETMHLPFFLDDHTGQVLVNPLGVELDLQREFHEEYRAACFSALSLSTGNGVPAAVADFLRRNDVTPVQRIRVEECCIRPKDFLFAMGTLAEKSDVDARPVLPQMQEAGERAATGSLLHRLAPVAPAPPAPQVIRLSESTATAPAEMTQQSKIAAALLRAGIQNPVTGAAAGVPSQAAACQQIPQITEIVVNHRPENFAEDSGVAAHENRADAASTDETAPPVVLLKGLKNPVFLISWRCQSEWARALAWRASAMICGGATLTLLGLYLLA